MSIAASAPAWLVVCLVALLAIAAIEDGWRLRISNLIVLGIAVTGITAIAMAGIGWSLWQPLVVAAAILAVGTPLYSAGWMGGGDVKLLAASALWFDLDGAWKMLVAVALAGGVVALCALVLQRFAFSPAVRERVSMLQRGRGVPYGIAVAVGVASTVIAGRSALL